MDRYVRVRKIGEGSFGKALLVKKKNDGKHYVIKEINISRMKPREREDSKKEVKVLSQLKHPNIVSYKESFEETGNLYIVMDYCDGGDLYKKINGQRGVLFPEEQVMDWFVQIALGLKHVHDRKILHRDIKSQNIFLTRNGMVKLGDFGIARVLHNTFELARTCIGTPYYLSPEIVENRPYNNKSDIWSLGCVLYEMLTLKHAFEAGNMKNLVLKIIRGSYPPVPIRYSGDIRTLLSQLLKSKPQDRPSVNNILKKNFIQKRIQKFLSEQAIEDEFSHTVLHRKPFGVQGQRPLPARPAPVKPAPVRAAPAAAAPRISEPKAKYSVSVARKKPQRKPRSGGEVAKKPAKPVAANSKPADKKVEVDARERRRRELINQQDQQYNDYMKKVQQQRWEKQQREHINKAREQAWKNTMSVGLSPDKGNAAANQQAVVNKDPQPMHKYKRPLSAVEQKENIPEPAPKPVRPASANSNVNPALEAARQGQINRGYGAEAAERARIKEEFWSRKRAAAMNKKRGQADYGGYEYKPPIQPKGYNAQAGNMGRNHQEEDYLSRLEAIRRQNYAERREIQKRMAGVRGPAEAPKKDDVSGDPRYDPEARRKKIAALKMQAEERAAMLRKQLDKKKKAVLERLNKAGKEKWEEEQKKIKAEEKPNPNERVFVPSRRAVPEEKPPIAVAAVGLETALKQVGIGTLYRSNSENDIPKISKEDEHVVRKQWGDIPFKPRMLPLEVTASHMEATGVNDAVIKPSDNHAARKQWGQQKTQVVSALEKIKLQTATSTIVGRDESDAAGVGQTITISKSQPSSPGIGQTITVSKETTPGGLPVVGQTMTVSPSPTGSPQTVILRKDALKTVTEECEETKAPVKAWEDKPSSPNGASESPADSNKKEHESNKPTSPREAYEQFLKSSTNEQKSDQQQQPLFNKVEPKAESASSEKSNDLQVEDLSVDESSFHTADGSPDKTSRTNLLKTGIYDTNSKHLRTCSMPDLRLLFATPVKDAAALNGEDDENTEDNDEEDENVEDENEEDNDDNEDDNDGDDDGDDGDDDEFNEDEEEDELQGSPVDDEDSSEYENMLASMRDVLVSSARSPSPMKAVGTAQSMEWDPSADTESPSVDDADGRSSEMSNLNEDWDSGEGEDNDDDNNDEKQDKQDDDNDDNSVFQRLEESRQALEQELGFDRFLRVYRYLQTIQENDDEDANVSSSSDEITELLGDKEHLYPKILYLVIADSAYSEENQ